MMEASLKEKCKSLKANNKQFEEELVEKFKAVDETFAEKEKLLLLSSSSIMVQQLKIKVTEKLKSVVQANVQLGCQPNIPPNIETVLKSSTKHAKDKTNRAEIYLEIEDIKWLHAHVVEGLGDVFLHELISGEDIVLPEPEVLPRNPELEARVRRLKVQQMEREYRSMTKNVDSVRVNHPEDTISYQMKQINRQLIAVVQFIPGQTPLKQINRQLIAVVQFIVSVGAGFTFDIWLNPCCFFFVPVKQINRQLIAVVQFIVSVGAGFTFGFIGVELIVGELDFGFRLLLGVICSLIIALAEIYFLAKKLADDLVPPLPPGEAGSVTSSGGVGAKEKLVTGKSHQD
ncbi:hypothetical protein WDU94_003751 [Cyamophila willieti]